MGPASFYQNSTFFLVTSINSYTACKFYILTNQAELLKKEKSRHFRMRDFYRICFN